ncbi:transcriptional regulator family: Fungal Specific TF [Penicillium riverlandense]|uniref:transcriptional regulator family: Fungal Specific TF n=1 Tax=Penicillium riverlandense TaxID=1903569 RepID=UPI0025477819|nr:transcriptional regulator family: Fungal Specific TF [Penicillium riverlandense]KAJ5833404.1 transcriptional regulator family: Fungal Specific TF [Penicillium riverlandense]
MMSGKRSEFQFIHTSQPGVPGVASAEKQRLVHSHAARAAHAKARRQRLVEYRAIKTRSGSEDERQPFSTAAAETAIAVIPSPLGFLGSDRRDPFASFARRLNPIEDFLLDYYMANVVPCSNLQRCQISHPESRTQHLNKQFIQLAATNASSLNGLFLVTCRHLSQCLPHKGPYFIQLALQYKIACARSLMEAISSSGMRSPISDSTLVLALFLAHDDILIGDGPSTKIHVQGAIQMARHNSALQKTDLKTFPYDLIQRDM